MNSYTLLDAGGFQRLEQWGEYTLVRPEPSAHWPKQNILQWQSADAEYQSSAASGGQWKRYSQVPDRWPVTIGTLQFIVGLGSSKHTGLFPEQLQQWQALDKLIREHSTKFTQPIRVLNLFAYTGAASCVAAAAGAFTTHVDSSAPAIGRAKENQAANNLSERSIRWIRDDVLSFVRREIKRGNQYEIICLDPPAYGAGIKGERFSFIKEIETLLTDVSELLSEKALTVFLTTYNKHADSNTVAALCQTIFPEKKVQLRPLSLRIASTGLELTTGTWVDIQLS